MKKTYIKPAMRIHVIQGSTRLLQQSGDQWLNYAPGSPSDMNQLA